jgi:uracil-DNA glycosylase
MNHLKLEESWQKLLHEELQRPYMKDLWSFLLQEKKSGHIVYPREDHIFAALNLTPFEKVKVVILGQDPYHGPAQAHGLCFSVGPGIKIPPSLVNIFKELKSDTGLTPPQHGNLESWAQQGVLLLNNVLTVQEGKAGSHHLKGWEEFTDKIIQELNEKKDNLVFILWGAPAQNKAKKVDASKHFIIKAPHPSPLSSYRGFFGSRPFTQTNQYLTSKGITPIDWSL